MGPAGTQNRPFLSRSTKLGTFSSGDSIESIASRMEILFTVTHDQAFVLGLALTRSSHDFRFPASAGRCEPPSGAPKVIKQ